MATYRITVPVTCLRVSVGQQELKRIFLLYYVERWFTSTQNRQNRQLRRLYCERLIHSVFALPVSALPRPLPSVGHCMIYCCCENDVSVYQVMSQRGNFNLESIMSSPFRKGYSSINGKPNQHHGWMTLQRSLMYEDGLEKVMSVPETTSTAPEEDTTQVQRAEYAKESRRFEEKNSTLFTRVIVSTTSVTALGVQAHGPVGTVEFEHGGDAVMAREDKYRLNGEPRMQELYDQLANL